MITKESFSDSAVWKPDLEGAINGTGKKIAGPCEVTYLKLSSGVGSAFVSIYDARDSGGATAANLKWVLDTSTTDNDNNLFTSPLSFRRGVFAVLEQGAGNNPVVGIARYGLDGKPNN